MTNEDGSESNAIDLLSQLLRYAVDSGLQAELELDDESDDDYDQDYPGYVSIDFPNGRDVRRIPVVPSSARTLLESPLSSFSFLGDYFAFINRATGEIEARVVLSGAGTSPILRSMNLWRLPGVEILQKGGDEDDLSPDDYVRSPPANWRLRLEEGHKSIELSPPSDLGSALLQRGPRTVTLKLAGFGAIHHDDGLEILEGVAESFFFELDLLYDKSLVLARRPNRARSKYLESVAHAPEFPVNEYAPEALALYHYGRSAVGLPLLEFLAYYQALEYFFPSFAHEETTKALRIALANPRFDPTDDNAIAGLIRTASPAGRAGLGEREQLRATIRAVASKQEIRSFFKALEGHLDLLYAKKQEIRGIAQVTPDATDIQDQLADRIYAIRCRIVHTKSDGGSAGDDVLLPTSSEAAALGPEIAVVRFLAQQAILARARRRR